MKKKKSINCSILNSIIYIIYKLLNQFYNTNNINSLYIIYYSIIHKCNLVL